MGDVKKVTSMQIFDLQKYLDNVRAEMPGNYKFVEAISQK